MYQSAATIARRWFEEVWNDNRDAAIDELMHPEAVFHMEGAEVHSPPEFRKMRDSFMSAFPGLTIELEDVVANGEQAIVRWRFQGTHLGSGFGEGATQQRITFRGISWAVVRDGKIIEGFDSWNIAGLMTAIGAPPVLPAAERG